MKNRALNDTPVPSSGDKPNNVVYVVKEPIQQKLYATVTVEEPVRQKLYATVTVEEPIQKKLYTYVKIIKPVKAKHYEPRRV